MNSRRYQEREAREEGRDMNGGTVWDKGHYRPLIGSIKTIADNVVLGSGNANTPAAYIFLRG